MQDERGASVIEYIDITAVALALAIAIFSYLPVWIGKAVVCQPSARRPAGGVIDNMIGGFRAVDAARW